MIIDKVHEELVAVMKAGLMYRVEGERGQKRTTVDMVHGDCRLEESVAWYREGKVTFW